MNKRNIVNDKKLVSEIGLGTWQFCNTSSWKGPDKKKAIKMVKTAYNLGCNFFDTAPNYSNGESEIVLGEAINSLDIRKNVFINTKFGHWSDGSIDFDPDKIEDSVLESLDRLSTKYIDSLVLHNPSSEILEGKTKHFEILSNLKNKGLINHFGVSVDTSKEMIKAIQNTNIDVIEVMFNMIHQEPKKAFDLAKKENISIIVKVPLDSGWLTGKYDKDSSFNGIRDRWSKKDIFNRDILIKDLKEIIDGKDIILQALSFILSYDEITTVIPGAKNKKQLKHNLSASKEPIEKEIKEKIENLYNKKIKDMNIPW